MRVTLIHNASAGEGNCSAKDLMAWLEYAGFDARYQSSSEKGWKSALKKPADVFIAAGGDGTVTKVATALPADALLAVLPLGTANNIATGLGIHGAPERVIAKLHKLKPKRFDRWRAEGPWGEEIVVEAAGLGAVTETGEVLHFAGDLPLEPLDKLTLARMVMKSLVAKLRPFELRAECDGEVVEGSFLAFEMMNIGLAGPQLSLCGSARHGDGKLALAVVRETERDAFVRWLSGNTLKSWRKTPLLRCESLTLRWNGERLRIADGLVWPPEKEKAGKNCEARFSAGDAIQVLVPE